MIVYLHGFRSGPQSGKVRALAARMAELGLADRLWCEQLPCAPAEAIAFVEAKIAACEEPPTLVGSSLGAFYATWLAERHGLKAALINPLVLHEGLDPALFLGEHKMLYTGERFVFTPEHIEQILALDTPVLSQPSRFWLLVEEGDETLDHRQAVRRYAGARQTVLSGGCHGFTRWNDYIDEVLRFAGILPLSVR